MQIPNKLDEGYLFFIIREAAQTQDPRYLRETFPGLPEDAVTYLLNGGAWEVKDGNLIIP